MNHLHSLAPQEQDTHFNLRQRNLDQSVLCTYHFYEPCFSHWLGGRGAEIILWTCLESCGGACGYLRLKAKGILKKSKGRMRFNFLAWGSDGGQGNA